MESSWAELNHGFSALLALWPWERNTYLLWASLSSSLKMDNTNYLSVLLRNKWINQYKAPQYNKWHIIGQMAFNKLWLLRVLFTASSYSHLCLSIFLRECLGDRTVSDFSLYFVITQHSASCIIPYFYVKWIAVLLWLAFCWSRS